MHYEQPKLITLNNATYASATYACSSGFSDIVNCNCGSYNHTYNCQNGAKNDGGDMTECDTGGLNSGWYCNAGQSAKYKDDCQTGNGT